MHWALAMLALESSGRELGKLLAGLVVVVLLALVLAVSAPVVLIVGTMPTWLARGVPAPPIAAPPIAAPPIAAPPLPAPRPVPPGASQPTPGPLLAPPTGAPPAFRSTRPSNVRWHPFSPCPAASAAPSSPAAGPSAAREYRLLPATPKGPSMSNPQPIILLFDPLLDAAPKVGLAAAALFLA